MKKKPIIKIFICIIVIGLFWVVNQIISSNRYATFYMKVASNQYTYQVEKLDITDSEIAIEGWFIPLKNVRGEYIDIDENVDFNIVLYDVKNNDELLFDTEYKGIAMDMEYLERKDVNNYFSCEYDYSKCGFIAKTDLKDIKPGFSEYLILFKPKEKEALAINSGTYIYDNKLNNVPSCEIGVLDVKDTDLEVIKDEGKCVAASSEYGFWIYQYNWKLYWIAENRFFKTEDNNTYISMIIDTTQYEILSKILNSDDATVMSENYSFEEYEITNTIDCGKYRVSEKELPQDYSITMIFMGNEKWQRYIRPVYLFK